jgi:hypothetical protein
MNKCPACGEWAYLGFSNVECSNESCKFFTIWAKAEKHEASLKVVFELEHREPINRGGDCFYGPSQSNSGDGSPANPQATVPADPQATTSPQDAPGQTMMDFGDPPDDSHLNLEYDMDMP